MLIIVPHFLASTAPTSAERSASEVIPWLILFIGLVLVGGVLIFYVRRWMKGDGGQSEVGFTLQDLREMHARGDLSDIEFQSARAAMIGRIAAEKSAAAVTDPASDDSDSTAGG
jgi:hypothetical protein